MYSVYIIYSEKLKRYYIGTTDNFEERLKEHNNSTYSNAYTSKGIPWERILVIENLSSFQAYGIEKHIKRMKSSVYIKNLIKYPEMIERLKQQYL
ncbi:MAG: GIY-YIG nuclease family protein [Bacteroidia bacterium]